MSWHNLVDGIVSHIKDGTQETKTLKKQLMEILCVYEDDLISQTC